MKTSDIDKGLKSHLNEISNCEHFRIPKKIARDTLTPAEIERLAVLVEECAEVQQIAMKILRHGYESHNPFDAEKVTNRRLLQTEIGDLQLSIELLAKNKDVDLTRIAWAQIDKRERIKKYLHHNTI